MGATVLEAVGKRRALRGQKSAMISESHLICCCLIDEGATLDRALSAGLSGADFSDTKLATTFEELRTLRQKNKPITVTGLVEQLGPRLKMFGSIETVMALSDSAQVGHTTTHAGHHLKEVIKASISRRLASGAEIGEIQHLLDAVIGTKAVPTSHRTPFSFGIPPANDRSILLGNRYLNRGDGLVLSSSSGMGKSSMSHQMAGDWALGLPFHGIMPNGALRILIVQSEDSDGDIAEVWQSLKHVKNWTDEQITQLESNVRIISERALRGKAFLNWLKKEVADFKPDLVILNPLQAFIDGDVTDSRDLGFFLREGLNGINKDSAFGYIIVHHTTKPATGKDRAERQWHEVMYDMAGGAEIINWARAIISLRATPTEGQFKAVLAKRGRRANVTTAVDQGAGTRLEIVTTIGLKHAQGTIPGTKIGLICWEGCELKDADERTSKGGRPSKYKISDFTHSFPVHDQPGKPAAVIHRDVAGYSGIPITSFKDLCSRAAQEGFLERLKTSAGETVFRLGV